MLILLLMNTDQGGWPINHSRSYLCNWFNVFSYNHSALVKSPHLQFFMSKFSLLSSFLYNNSENNEEWAGYSRNPLPYHYFLHYSRLTTRLPLATNKLNFRVFQTQADFICDATFHSFLHQEKSANFFKSLD